MQRLAECRLIASIACARAVARRTTKRIEELHAAAATIDRVGERTQRRARILGRNVGDRRDRVEHRFSRQPARRDAGKRRWLHVRIGTRGLVGARRRDLAHDGTHVESRGNERGGEMIEQFGMRWRIADAHVVDGIDEAAAEHARPEPIGDVAREVRVVAIHHPVGKHGAAIRSLGDLCLALAEQARLRDRTVAQVAHLAVAAIPHDVLVGIEPALLADLAEERGDAVVVVHRPPLERVVVALRALQSHAQEHLRGLLRDEMRLARDELEVGRRVRERRPRRSEQLAHRLVERALLLELRAQPTSEHRGALLLHRQRVDLQHVGPHRRLQCRERRPFEQFVDEPRALVRPRIGDKRAHRVWRRQRAEQVDVDATHELLVAARRSALRARCDERLAHMRVDRAAFGLRRERECRRVFVHAHARDRSEA